MKLSVINGSPRSKNSNSRKILNWITQGLTKTEVGEVEYISFIKKQDEIINRCAEADSLLFSFPLYVDSMPAQQMLFFEKLEENKDKFIGKSVSYIIHSGFPEMIQSESLKEYLEYFSTEVMGMNLLGVAIIGGSEALQVAPDSMFSKQIKELDSVIEAIDYDKKFPDDLNTRLNKVYKLSPLQQFLYTLNPFKHFYWNYRASKHKFKVNLKARPY